MRTSLLAAALALVACQTNADEGSCPEPKRVELIRSGTFRAPGGEAENLFCASGCGVVFPPHEGATDIELQLDRAANVAVFRFTKNGRRVEERWTITVSP